MESTQYSTLLVGGLPAGFAQRSPPDASHATLRPAHGPADGMANAPTIVDPPPPKILTPAPPLVDPPAHLMIRAKSANPIPKWKQPQPGAPYIYFVAAERASSCVTASFHPDRRSLCAEHPCRTHPQRPPTSTGSRQPLPGEKHGGGTRGVTSSCSTEALSGANSRPSQVQAAGLQQVSSCRHLGG